MNVIVCLPEFYSMPKQKKNTHYMYPPPPIKTFRNLMINSI